MYCIMCGTKIDNLLKIKIKYTYSYYSYHAPICSEQKCIDEFIQHKKLPTHKFNGFCKVCGEEAELRCCGFGDGYSSSSRYHHIQCKKGIAKNPTVVEIKKEYPNIPKRHYLKPWKDPDSLFCSPKLKEIIKKEPRKGKECK